MAKSIVAEFPSLDNEDKDGYEVWFTPGSGKHDASGFLENRLRNIRKRHAQKVESESTVPEKSRLISTVDLDLSTEELQEADLAAMVTWLKFHTTPQHQVQEMMEKTAKYRLSKIRRAEHSISSILEEYPRILDTDGMIEQDFRMIFPEVADSLYMKWAKICNAIITFAEKQLKWRDLLNFTGTLETGNHINLGSNIHRSHQSYKNMGVMLKF
ncbi:hypothetical protein HOLleu_45135 [Holothuria leucospilota]|uniref:Uncharacterized protein n=1 Tax=Holothuria leucospilota TaxID=206669 RepID=A0A9Q1B947_HOLLE|nr:hypothetical protein HOLleu_45135 [Holothuria leucospilota]